MINPNKIVENCCISTFKSPSKRDFLSPDRKQVWPNVLTSKKKISLKPYRAIRYLIQSQFTRVSRQNPESPSKSIINYLYPIEKTIEIVRQPLPQIARTKNPMNYKLERYHSPDIKSNILVKAKSLTKVSFTYKKIDNYFGTPMKAHQLNQKNRILMNTPIPQKISFQNNQTSTNQKLQSPTKCLSIHNQISKSKSIMDTPSQLTIQNAKNKHRQSYNSCDNKSVLTFMKKQDDDDLRSTMQPFLQLPRPKLGRPKSIVSIQDEQQRQDFMEQSMIIEKHSSNKNLVKLV